MVREAQALNVAAARRMMGDLPLLTVERVSKSKVKVSYFGWVQALRCTILFYQSPVPESITKALYLAKNFHKRRHMKSWQHIACLRRWDRGFWRPPLSPVPKSQEWAQECQEFAICEP